jgi:tetratricopeptide (TPR) repeat protein
MPRVMVSWTAWNADETAEDTDHVARVHALAASLRNHGVDVVFHPWSCPPGTDLNAFHDDGVGASDFVLLLCTPAYKRRYEEAIHGVGEEAKRIEEIRTHGVLTSRFIPLFAGDAAFLPAPFARTYALDLLEPKDHATLLDAIFARHQGPPLGVAWWGLEELPVDIVAEVDVWTIGPPGHAVRHPPPDLATAGAWLRAVACKPIEVDEHDHPTPQSALLAAKMRTQAREVGEVLTNLLPEPVRALLRRRLAGPKVADLRLRFSGARRDDALKLPWELLWLDDAHPVETGRLQLLRDIALDVSAAPQPQRDLRVIGHVAMPEGPDVAELHLEEASMRVSRALDAFGAGYGRFTELGRLDDLTEAVRTHRPSLVMFSGHGSPGALLFESDDGGKDSVPVVGTPDPSGRVRDVLSALRAGGDLPAAVWLSCCYGEGGGEGPEPNARHRDAASPRDTAAGEDNRGDTAPAPAGGDVDAGGADPGAPAADDAPSSRDTTTGERAAQHAAVTPSSRDTVTGDRAAHPAADVFSSRDTATGDRAAHPAADVFSSRDTASGERAARDASTAAALHANGIPHVLGYFGPVPDPLAVEVDRALAQALVDNHGDLRAVIAPARAAAGKVVEHRGFRLRFPLGWSLIVVYDRGVPPRLVPGAKVATPPALSVGGLPALLHGFIGRRRLLHRLRQSAARAGIALHGEGGMGKTSATIKLAAVLGGDGWQQRTWVLAFQTDEGANRARGARPGEVAKLRHVTPAFELVARVVDRLKDAPDGVAREIELKDLETRPLNADWGHTLAVRFADAIGLRFPRSPGDPVVIFDNVESLMNDPVDGEVQWGDEAVAAFFNHLLGFSGVLLSSRYVPTGAGAGWAPIDHCTPDELLRMTTFHPYVSQLTGVERLKLASRLDGHPRSLTLVEGLLKSDRTFNEDPSAALNRALDGLPTCLSADLLVDRLVAGLDDAGKQHLTECLVLNLPVPEDLLHKLGDRFAELRDRSLLTLWRGTDDRWRVHPTIVGLVERGGMLAGRRPERRAEVGRYWKENRETYVELDESIAQLFGAGLWAEGEEEVRFLVREYRTRGWIRQRLEKLRGLGVEGAPVGMRAAVHRHLGEAYDNNGAYADAERELSSAILLAPPEQRSFMLHAFANLLTNQGRYDEAERAYQESIDIQTRGDGSREHAEVAASLHGLANVLNRRGRYDEAVRAYQESVDIKTRAYGSREHAEVAASLHGLANVLFSHGRYDDAVRAYQESIDIQTRAYGSREHASVAASLAGLANVRSRQGRYDEAVRAYQESIDIQARAYGSQEHAEVAASLVGLAKVLSHQGRYDEAVRAYQESIDIQTRAYGSREHAEVAASLHGLANVLSNQGRYHEAVRAYQESIDIQTRAYGAREHADVAASLHGLANVLESQGRYDEAVRAYQESVDIKTCAYGSREHAEVAVSLHGLANVLSHQGRYDEAGSAYQESIDIQTRAYGAREHASVAASLHGLANVLSSQGRYDEAIRIYRECIDIEATTHGTRAHPETLPTLCALASTLLRANRVDEALPVAMEAWQTANRLGIVHHAVQCALSLITALSAKGQADAARTVLDQTRTLLNTLPPDHPVRRNVEVQLANLGGPAEGAADLPTLRATADAAQAANDAPAELAARLQLYQALPAGHPDERPSLLRARELAVSLGQTQVVAQIDTITSPPPNPAVAELTDLLQRLPQLPPEQRPATIARIRELAVQLGQHDLVRQIDAAATTAAAPEDPAALLAAANAAQAASDAPLELGLRIRLYQALPSAHPDERPSLLRARELATHLKQPELVSQLDAALARLG